eukprot:696025-Rhodomonas_salina.3
MAEADAEHRLERALSAAHLAPKTPLRQRMSKGRARLCVQMMGVPFVKRERAQSIECLGAGRACLRAQTRREH